MNQELVQKKKDIIEQIFEERRKIKPGQQKIIFKDDELPVGKTKVKGYYSRSCVRAVFGFLSLTLVM